MLINIYSSSLVALVSTGGVATAFGNEFVFSSITYKFSRYNSKMWRLKDIDGQIMTRETCDITEAKQKF